MDTSCGHGMPEYKDKKACPVHGNYHVFKPTGESRKTDCWFYKTEEHYRCDCGKSYWDAGLFSFRKHEN